MVLTPDGGETEGKNYAAQEQRVYNVPSLRQRNVSAKSRMPTKMSRPKYQYLNIRLDSNLGERKTVNKVETRKLPAKNQCGSRFPAPPRVERSRESEWAGLSEEKFQGGDHEPPIFCDALPVS